MLELKNIHKDYPVGTNVVQALKGISLNFREHEFVAILGPSGCGKTTMLNITGGLDGYTDGDLIVNGKSTKDFSDRDWDSYRNHSVGFVFQSYNLIPHQSVLQNVELALSLSGVSKAERKNRAKQALEDVGLGDQLNKRPAEMSGGQMQRVAIARALVNNPDIILADEPTGALDSETSTQVMDILKEIAKERLVVVVTHNPMIAERYATRIIRMLDGEIISDSNPLNEAEIEVEREKEKAKSTARKSEKKPSMSIWTSFFLSLNNLFTKKGRTMLTAFAGSIGIIGIALIFAVSRGMTTYINTIQEETLTSYPLTLEAEPLNMGTMFEMFIDKATSGSDHENDAVYQKAMVYDMVTSLNTAQLDENDLKAFKAYIETERANAESNTGLRDALSGIQYTYDTELLVYTENVDGSIIQSDAIALFQELMLDYFDMDLSLFLDVSDSMGATDRMTSMANMSPMSPKMIVWQEILPGNNGKLVNPLLEKQYDVIYGSWPTAYDEIVLIVDENNEIDDMTLYALGLKSKDDIDAMAKAALHRTELKPTDLMWSFEDICAMEFRVILNADSYTYDEITGRYIDLRDTQAGLKYLYDNATPLKVSGIIRPDKDAIATMLNGAIGYTSKLTEYIAEKGKDSAAVQAQLANPSVDLLSGRPFRDKTTDLPIEEKASEFREYISTLDDNGKADAYVKIMSLLSQEELDAMLVEKMTTMTRSDIESNMINALMKQMLVTETDIRDYIGTMADEDITSFFSDMLIEQLRMEYAADISEQLSTMSTAQLADALDTALSAATDEQLANYHDELIEFSESTFEGNLRKLGYVDLDSPATINLFASSFENKDVIEAAIADYNKDKDELSQITYTDYVGLMMSSVTAIINAITSC